MHLTGSLHLGTTLGDYAVAECIAIAGVGLVCGIYTMLDQLQATRC